MMAARATDGEPPTKAVYKRSKLTVISVVQLRLQKREKTAKKRAASTAMLNPEMAMMCEVPVS